MSSLMGHHVTDRCHGAAKAECMATGNVLIVTHKNVFHLMNNNSRGHNRVFSTSLLPWRHSDKQTNQA